MIYLHRFTSCAGSGGQPVDMRHGAPKEIDEPLPIRVFVVVGGSMKTKPCSATLHIAFKGASLFRLRGRLVKPDDELTSLQSLVAQILPIGGCFKLEVLTCGSLTEERHRLLSKLNVIRFGFVGIKSQNPKSGLLCERMRTGKGDCHQEA